MTRRLLALAVAAIASTASGADARAATGLEVGIEDERILLDEPLRAPGVVAAWAAAGMTVARVHARWNRLTPAPHSPRRPAGFDPSDPTDPGYDWTELDRAVGLLQAAGIKAAVTLTGPGPVWSSGRPSRGPNYKPRPREYAAFTRAVARRYRGRVARYLLWNEPNIPGWLAPQWDCPRRGACADVAPHLYRRLVLAATPVIRAEDPGAEVLIGELAPIGFGPRGERKIMAPLRFFRALGCVDERFRPLRSGPCRDFEPVTADGVGHHPHPVDLAPDQPSGEPGWAKMGDLRRFGRTLDRLTARRRIRVTGGGRLPLHLTEFGYQTSPPDHAVGIPMDRAARWIQQTTYLAWRDPRVRSLVHYQWEDEPVRWRGNGSLAYAGWQSGLHSITGEPKPSLAAVTAPLVVDRARGRIWGQVLAGAEQVTLERDTGSGFRTVGTLAPDAAGFFSHSLRSGVGDLVRVGARTVRVSGSRLSAAR